jgi:hypothetical protein
MLGYGGKPSKFGFGGSVKRQEKQTGAQAASEGAERLGRFGSAMKDKSKGGDAVSRIQAYAKSENERKKREEEEKRKKAAAAPAKSTAPQQGFFSRMYDKYVGGKKEQ